MISIHQDGTRHLIHAPKRPPAFKGTPAQQFTKSLLRETREEVREILRALRLAPLKKGETVLLGGQRYTLGQLMLRRLDRHTERLVKQAKFAMK